MSSVHHPSERLNARVGVPSRVSLPWAWLCLLLLGPALYPVLTTAIGTRAYDAATAHIYRSLVFSGSISDGVLYPRWVQFLHLGLGSPLFTFQGPLPYYALDLLYRAGLPHPLAWQAMIGVGLLVAGAGAYQLVRQITGQRWPALLAGVAYLYAPYMLRNTFERGSLEAIGMYLYPWVLWALIWVAERPGAKRVLVASLLWAACIAAHVLAPLMLAPFAGLVAVLLAWRWRSAAPVLALILGGLLAAIVWAPMIPEQRWVSVEHDFSAERADVVQNSIPLDRLLALPAVYDTVRDNNSTDDRVGLFHVALALIGLPAAAYAWRRRDRTLAVGLALAAGIALFLLWFLTAGADPIWQIAAPWLSRLQFRSRLLGVQALAAATTAGLLLAVMRGRWQQVAGLLLSMVLLLSALPSLFIDLQHAYATFGNDLSQEQVRTAEIASGGSAFTAFMEFAPRWRTAPYGQQLVGELGAGFDAESEPLADAADGVEVLVARVRSSAWDLTVQIAEARPVALHLLYYPRWQARVDGKSVPLRAQPVTGYAELDLPAGHHDVSLRYGSTPAELMGGVLSAVTLLGLVLGTVVQRKSRPINPHASPPSRATGEVVEPGRLPSWWLLAALTLVFALKVSIVDPNTTWLRCVSTRERVCGAQATVSIPFQGAPGLRGYTLTARTLDSGDTLPVTMYWQTDEPLEKRLVAFVHIRNSEPGRPVNPETGSEIWAQDDHTSPAGLFATEYLPGRIYRDDFRVKLPSRMPAGEYFVEIGWSDPDTGEQSDPRGEAVQPPLRVLWRSLLLPSITVR